ncbi:SUMF1/EgtB/PvdO family nonheme iron enzyme, partial [bacterium]|nr:SUMF1/EgtB/PvdO family nonheme iron enzyme [bacterium]
LNEVGNKKVKGRYWYLGKDIGINKSGKWEVVLGRENYPVNYVSYYGAEAYAKWAGKRLPTYSEWKFVATGRHSEWKYPWGNEWDPKKCNWKENGAIDGYKKLAPVNAFPNGKSAYDCYNMVGNDWEYIKMKPGEKMQRHYGGCYKYDKEYQTVNSFLMGFPEDSYPCVGFRCVKDIEISGKMGTMVEKVEKTE